MSVVICPECELQMKLSTRGIGAEAMAVFGSYQLFAADCYQCPRCGKEVVTDLGRAPISEHYQPEHQRLVELFRTPPKRLVRWWCNMNEKRQFEEGR